jgi:hypothetical protein
MRAGKLASSVHHGIDFDLMASVADDCGVLIMVGFVVNQVSCKPFEVP